MDDGDTNVTAFPRRDLDRIVFVCGECGCLTHYLRADGVVECAVCGSENMPAGDWRLRLPAVPADAKPIESGAPIIRDLNSPDIAIKHMLKNVKADELMGLILLRGEGSVSTWGTAHTQEQADWISRRLKQAFRLMARGFSEEASDAPSEPR